MKFQPSGNRGQSGTAWYGNGDCAKHAQTNRQINIARRMGIYSITFPGYNLSQ
jgi:hypothetical protein